MNEANRSPIFCASALRSSSTSSVALAGEVLDDPVDLLLGDVGELDERAPARPVGGDLGLGQPLPVDVAEEVVLGTDLEVHPLPCVVEDAHAPTLCQPRMNAPSPFSTGTTSDTSTSAATDTSAAKPRSASSSAAGTGRQPGARRSGSDGPERGHRDLRLRAEPGDAEVDQRGQHRAGSPQVLGARAERPVRPALARGDDRDRSRPPRTCRATAVRFRRQAPTTSAPLSASAAQIDDPFGDGRTSRSTPVTEVRSAGLRLTAVPPCGPRLEPADGQRRVALLGVRRRALVPPRERPARSCRARRRPSAWW